MIAVSNGTRLGFGILSVAAPEESSPMKAGR
jgi:hypothetical protein